MNKGFPAGRIDVEGLRVGTVEWSGELPGSEDVWGTGLDFARAPRLEYRAEPGGHDGVRVTGRLSAELHLACRRCLEPVDWPLEIEFDYRFDPSVEAWEEEDGVYALDPDSAFVDLVRPLREELVLAVPEYPVCVDGCRGLCPICGANWNETECDCRPASGDARWDVLKKLVSDEQPGAAGTDEAQGVNEA